MKSLRQMCEPSPLVESMQMKKRPLWYHILHSEKLLEQHTGLFNKNRIFEDQQYQYIVD